MPYKDPEKRRQWVKRNADKLKEGRKKYTENNKAKLQKYAKEYRKLNKDKAKEDGRKWRLANPEKARELNRAWVRNNADKVKVLKRADYIKHRDKRLAHAKQYNITNGAKRADYRKTHKKQLSQTRRAWAKKNPEKTRQASRRSYKKNVDKIRERSSIFYQANKEKILRKNAEYRYKHRTCGTLLDDGTYCRTQVHDKGQLCAVHDPLKLTYKRRELVVANYLRVVLSRNYDSWNKAIRGANKKYRPDFIYILEDRVIIVEVDEGQHRRYGLLQELDRMRDIASCYPGKIVMFVRWNPDGFCSQGRVKSISRRQKLQNLAVYVESLFGSQASGVTVHYMYYDHDYECRFNDDMYVFSKTL